MGEKRISQLIGCMSILKKLETKVGLISNNKLVDNILKQKLNSVDKMVKHLIRITPTDKDGANEFYNEMLDMDNLGDIYDSAITLHSSCSTISDMFTTFQLEIAKQNPKLSQLFDEINDLSNDIYVTYDICLNFRQYFIWFNDNYKK